MRLLPDTNISSTSGLACGWSGGTAVAHETFALACETAGLVPPAPISLASALSRAMRDTAGRDRLSRAYAAPGETRRSRGKRALVNESVIGSALSYSVALRAEVVTADGVERVVIFDSGDAEILRGSWHYQGEEADALREAIAAHVATLSADDVKSWLRETIVSRFGGVTVLREAGGVYYCPPRFAGEVRKVRGLVRDLAEVRMNLLPAATDDADAIQTILAGVEAEVVEALAAADGQCVKGARTATFAKHEDVLAKVEQKVRAYEALLNTQAAGLRGKIDEMQSRVAAAALGQFDFGSVSFGGATAAEEE
jgi:hypothetical protein